jgi:hypothetical protein
MKKLKILFLVVLGLFFVVLSIINSCRKGSGILGPGYVMPTPTATFTPDINYSVLIHQSGTPVSNVEVQLVKENTQTLRTKTDAKGIAGFKVQEYGKWSLLVDTFDDYKPQVFIVDPTSNTFDAFDYGIPSLELNLLSGNELIPISPSSITYTVKYHTKIPREKNIKINVGYQINTYIQSPQTVCYDNDELTIRLDIPKSFEGYNINKVINSTTTVPRQYLNIQAYTQGTASRQTTTTSNIRTLTKNWNLNITTRYYYMTLFDFQSNDAHVSYYAGIKDANLSNSYNIPFTGTIKYQLVEFGNTGSGSNAIIYSGLSNRCMPDFTTYGCFNALAKVNTNRDEYWAWRDGMNQNGWLVVRIFDDGYLDVKRRFETKNGWGIICYHWCCTSRDITRASYSCKWEAKESCSAWDRFRIADITRSRYQILNLTE